MTNVMEGIRILEVAEHTFVPAASAILSDWGAEVIKIEHVERGDAMRGLMNTGLAGLGGSVHVLNEHANRGKKSLGLDLTNPAGLDILYQLARAATCSSPTRWRVCASGCTSTSTTSARTTRTSSTYAAPATATRGPTPTSAATTSSGSGHVPVAADRRDARRPRRDDRRCPRRPTATRSAP